MILICLLLPVWVGENKVYFWHKDTIELLRSAIGLIKDVTPTNEAQKQNKALIIGRAYNNIGYYYRNVRDYPHALGEFRNALPHLYQSGDDGSYAHTVKNLGYLYSLLGKVLVADILCRDALATFRKLGDKSGEAPTLNTLGLVYVEARQPEIDQTQCKNALDLFQSLQDARGIGLANTALGYCARRLASRETYAPVQTIAFFQDARLFLTTSVDVFSNKHREPTRLVEAYSELGCTFRDWAKFSRDRNDLLEEIKNLEISALDYLQKAYDLAEELELTIEQADIVEDIAHVHFNRKDRSTTQEFLDKAEELIPAEYFISTTGRPQIDEPVIPYWAILGKTALLRGHLNFASTPEISAKWYQFASAYFDMFAETTTLTDYAVRSVYPKLRSLGIDQLSKWRQAANLAETEYKLGQTKLMQVLDETLGILKTPDENQFA